MTLIPVKPQKIDGIEFYVSPDGNETGMSVSGLARLCGVSEQSLNQRLLALLSQETAPAWKAPKCLERFQGKVFSAQLIGDNGGYPAKIVTAEVCAAVAEYYAFESKAANQTALYSYRKFAVTGIHNWIKEVTGRAEEGNNGKVLELLQQLIGKVDRLETTVEKYNNIRKTTISIFPPLNEMLDTFAENRTLPAGAVTLNTWLIDKGIVLTKSAKHRLANIVADTIKSTTGQNPKKLSIGGNRACVYTSEQVAILEMALKHLISQ